MGQTLEEKTLAPELAKPFDSRSRRSQREEVVSHSLPSWNQVLEWLLELDALRMGLQGDPGTLLASA